MHVREVRTSRTPVRPYSPVAFSLIWGTYNTVKSIYTDTKVSESPNYLLKVFFALWLLWGKCGFCKQTRRHNNVKLRHCVNQFMPRGWKWWANYSDCVTLVAVLCDRFLTTSPRTAGRRKQKPARSEWIRRTVSLLISPTLIVVYALCLQSAFCSVLPFS